MSEAPALEALRADAARLLRQCGERGFKVATAESCTGGMIAAVLTDIAGSSAVVERGFVVYTNEAKEEMLGVPHAVLLGYGAVSEPVARALADGALRCSRADLSVAVTGIAGPGGATPGKPVGLVHFAAARRGGASIAEHHVFGGDRDAVRRATVAKAFVLLRRVAGIE